MTIAAELIAALGGGLVVSCQAYPGEPMRHPETMAQVAEASVVGGAVGVRVQGLADVAACSGRVDVPLVGLWKVGHEGVFITPTLRHALAVHTAGADVVAIDGTRRRRPDGRTLEQTVAALHEAGAVVMADCGSVDDGAAAADAGADLVGTTLAGYTGDRPPTDGPDLALVAELARRLATPVVAEGRIRTPADARPHRLHPARHRGGPQRSWIMGAARALTGAASAGGV